MSRSTVFVLFALMISSFASAQVGLNAFYNFHISAPEWEEVVPEVEIYQNSIGFGLDYWFRLKNTRVEFLPEIGFRRQNTESSFVDNVDFEGGLSIAHFMLNTNIYFLDLEGDCDCPTFGKDGSFFKKGFYFQISPGVQHVFGALDVTDRTGTLNFDIQSTNFLVGIGAGLDIGLTKLLTITPWVRYIQAFNVEWPVLRPSEEPTSEVYDVKSSTRDLFLGLRIGYRFDYKGR